MTGPERDPRLGPLRALADQLAKDVRNLFHVFDAPAEAGQVERVRQRLEAAITEVEALLDPTPAVPEGDDVEALARDLCTIYWENDTRWWPSLTDDRRRLWLRAAREMLALGYRRTPAPEDETRVEWSAFLAGMPVGVGATPNRAAAWEDVAGWRADGHAAELRRRRVGEWEPVTDTE